MSGARIIERDGTARYGGRCHGSTATIAPSGRAARTARSRWRCDDCTRFTHPPKWICRHCRSEAMIARRVAGTGTIDTFTVNHQPWLPGLEVPFVIARVALDDVPGVYPTTNIIGTPIGQIAIGDRVQVVFEKQDDIYFPLFEKASARAG